MKPQFASLLVQHLLEADLKADPSKRMSARMSNHTAAAKFHGEHVKTKEKEADKKPAKGEKKPKPVAPEKMTAHKRAQFYHEQAAGAYKDAIKHHGKQEVEMATAAESKAQSFATKAADCEEGNNLPQHERAHYSDAGLSARIEMGKARNSKAAVNYWTKVKSKANAIGKEE